MVFRRPYGFLIKYFRLIHLLITGILGYLVICNNRIYSFINNCIEDAVYRYDALQYINYGIYILILLGIGLFFAIYLLFKYKNKPRNLYIFSIIGYVIVGIFMFILFNYMGELPNNILEQKVIRGYRDIMTITLGFQYLIVVIMFVRGLGFNIKKFNFEKDMQELNLTTEDNEEVEVDVSIDTTNIMRNVRKQKREFGYYFQEYKVFILSILFIILIVVGFNVYNIFKDIFLVYGQNEVIGKVNFTTIKNSYYKIDSNKNYIIVKFDVFKYGKKEQFNVNNLILKVGKEEYLPNKNICYNFSKLGNCYKKQYITNDSASYIVTYEVDSINSEKTYLLYKESYDDSFKVKLDLENYE